MTDTDYPEIARDTDAHEVRGGMVLVAYVVAAVVMCVVAAVVVVALRMGPRY